MSLVLLVTSVVPVVAQPKPVVRVKPGMVQRGLVSREAARQWAASFDAGDSYRTPDGPRALRRLTDVIAVCVDCEASEFQAQLLGAGKPLAEYRVSHRNAQGVTLLRKTAGATKRAPAQPAEMASLLAAARATPAGRSANPVFIDPTTGLRQLATMEFIVCLKPGVEAARYFGAAWAQARPVWGAPDQFVVTLADATAEAVFAEVNRHAARSEVAWAEPHFLVQVGKSYVPNDELFGDQWHLQNTGQFGARSGADAKLPGAWEFTLGNPEVVIAIMDDGVQWNHPDLAANIFVNANEIANDGQDNDGNGFIDDVRGWDFFASDNDPGPEHPLDNHGTALAGVAAAVGDNMLGVSGAAPRCRILPLKFITGEIEEISTLSISRAVHYAAGLNAQGVRVWRGADILNISSFFPQTTAVDTALDNAAARGRGGLGCAIFCASGNSAAAWVPFEIEFPVADVYTIRWQFQKDGSDDFRIGADTAWLDNVIFPDGTYESFEGGLPAEWVTGGDSPWRLVTDGVNGNHALTGWDGPGSHSVRAGRITHNQSNWIEITEFIDDGILRFWTWTEAEAGAIGDEFYFFDVLSIQVDGEELTFDGGVADLRTGVVYPASHASTFAVGASTDFDFRSDYSQSGAGLDFVAPSDGGAVSITTTDRTAADGYNEFDDYDYSFGGTSAAAPLASGVAALVLSMNPHLPLGDLRALLRGTCDHIGGVAYNENGFAPAYGYGRLNAERAVSRARPNLLVTVAAMPNLVVVGDPLTYTVSVRNNATSLSGPATLTVQLPAGIALGAITPPPSVRTGDELIWNTAPLSSGGLLTFRLGVTNTLPGTNILLASVGTDIVETTLADNAVTNKVVVTPQPLMGVSDVTVTELDAAATNAVFLLTLSNPSSRRVTVRYATTVNYNGGGQFIGTAGSRRDFAAVSGVLTFLPGEVAKSVGVRVLPDRLDEENENFALLLSGPVNAILADPFGVGTILDNDPLPALSVSDAMRIEGNAGALAMIFTARLMPASGRPVSVSFATAPGSAVEGTDFIGTNGTVVFLPGATSRTIAVPIVGDLLLESNETFLVNLSHPTNATLARSEATGTIVNNDVMPRLSISDATVVEGETGATNAVFNVRLAPASGLPVQVAFATTNGTAGAADFVATNGLLTFVPGETNQVIAVPVSGETLSESNELFFLRLNAPVRATLADGVARGLILDNDPLPVISVGDVTVAQQAGGPTNAAFSVSLSAPSGRTITVRYLTVSGTALAGADFITRGGVLTFAPGVTSQNVSITIARATIGEGEEDFLLNLTNPVNATLGDRQGRGVIIGTAPALALP